MTTKLCFIGDGQSLHTRRWLSAMVARGFDVHLITNRPALIEGVTIHQLTLLPGLLGWFAVIPKVRTLVAELNPDILHGHYVTSYGFLAATSGKRPLVLTAWGSDILVSPRRSWLKRQLTRWTLRRADLVTADSLNMLEEMRAYCPGVRLEQIQWGIDLDLFQRRHQEQDGVFHMVSLRMWEPLYNIDIIIAAFAELIKRRPECRVHLHLLGDGYLGPALREQAHQLGLDGHVTFHGRLEERQLIAVLQRSNVSVMVPSNDATAMSLLESMAMELPVVVSDLPANHQWVDERGGFVVPVGNAMAITAALEQLLDNPGLAAQMGQHNRALVAQRASRRQEMDRMATLYEELLDRA